METIIWRLWTQVEGGVNGRIGGVDVVVLGGVYAFIHIHCQVHGPRDWGGGTPWDREVDSTPWEVGGVVIYVYHAQGDAAEGVAGYGQGGYAVHHGEYGVPTESSYPVTIKLMSTFKCQKVILRAAPYSICIFYINHITETLGSIKLSSNYVHIVAKLP